jgi:hypothetical protein
MHAQFGKVALLVAGLTSLVAIPAQPAGRAQEVWGATSGGLRMSISAAEPGSDKPGAVELTVALQNVSGKDVVLNVGMMVGNGTRTHSHKDCADQPRWRHTRIPILLADRSARGPCR